MNHFPVLILTGRPASGKSEIIDYLLNAQPVERLQRFHVAQPCIIDDFPMLWTWFEEDHLLEKSLGQPRLHTDEQGYFKYEYLWHLLIERIGLEYQKQLRDDPNHAQTHTTIIEFSRGSEHGGYTQAFAHLSDLILAQATALYVRVSYAESLRKNRRRFNPNKPDSILEHSLPDAKLERLYKADDWQIFSSPEPHFLNVGLQRLPFSVFENEDDITTNNPNGFADRLESVLEGLWQIRVSSQMK